MMGRGEERREGRGGGGSGSIAVAAAAAAAAVEARTRTRHFYTSVTPFLCPLGIYVKATARSTPRSK